MYVIVNPAVSEITIYIYFGTNRLTNSNCLFLLSTMQMCLIVDNKKLFLYKTL